MPRATLSKRLRYEILRRDEHTCRYCGAAAPDVKLTVDHVVPVALGGSDEPTNLVTACADCNSGKSSTSPDAPILADVDRRAAAWARAMQQVADERVSAREVRESLLTYFADAWDRWGWTDSRGERQLFERGDGWESSVERFYAAGLMVDDLDELIEAAMKSKVADRWRYFCGCAWTRIRQAQDRAAQIVDEWEREGA